MDPELEEIILETKRARDKLNDYILSLNHAENPRQVNQLMVASETGYFVLETLVGIQRGMWKRLSRIKPDSYKNYRSIRPRTFVYPTLKETLARQKNRAA